jgi:hypothetical protein
MTQFLSSWLALLKPRRIRRRRGESKADSNSRHFRELEASYLSIGLLPKAATAAALKEILITLSLLKRVAS